MSIAALRDTIDLLTTRPALWLPGIGCGLLIAVLWLVLFLSGIFFAGRLMILVLLVNVFFVCCTYVAIRHDTTRPGDIIKEGAAYYFRVLTPTLVIVFGMIIVFMLVVLTLALFGTPANPEILTFLTFGVLFPTVMMTFFYDCAAVFEERKVFESLQRSIEVVTAHLLEVLLFYIGSAIIFCVVTFAFFVAWTAALADRLEPITHYNETQLAAFSPDQLTAIIGQDGLVVTTLCIFAAVSILFPLLTTYKACFFRILAGTTLPIQQTIGEYDSKGRWYKY